jgi:ferredoxin
VTTPDSAFPDSAFPDSAFPDSAFPDSAAFGVDQDRCCGAGMCTLAAPGVFDQGEVDGGRGLAVTLALSHDGLADGKAGVRG